MGSQLQLARVVACLAGLHLACSGPVERSAGRGGDLDSPTPFAFRDVAAEIGLDFVHGNGMAGDFHMMEVLGGGAALLDFDNDGDLDLYLVQGTELVPDPLRGAARKDGSATDRLYRNELVPEGRLRFVDVSAAAGALGTGYGMGVAVGDYDRDGFSDLLVSNYGPNQLLRNNGDGTFSELPVAAGLDAERWSLPAAFFDYDGDGWLDLYVGNYVEVSVDQPVRCADLTGAPDYCGPARFEASPDSLFHNRGDGTFEDVTAASGFGSVAAAPALGVLPLDVDGDGRLDLYVANDAEPNHLWMNQGDGRFREEALLRGAAVNRDGLPEGSMGIDADDVDGDGDLDLFVTHLSRESNTFYAGDGRGAFDDATIAAGLDAPSRPFTSFGAGWLDYDLDGWLDLVVASGAIAKIPELAAAGDAYPLGQTNQLFRNAGGGRFVDVSPTAGPAFASRAVSRGIAVGDLDNDGDEDVVVVNNNGAAEVLRNEQPGGPGWIGVRALDAPAGIDALGARVALVDAATPRGQRWVRTAGSYASSRDPRVRLLVPAGVDRADVAVVWPDATREIWTDLPVGIYSTLVRGRGRSGGE